MDGLRHDLRFSTRTLLKHPAFTAAGVLVLGLGIGVNTAMFSLVNAILYRPLPVRAPGELRYLYTLQANNPRPFGGTRYAEFVELRDRTTVFAGVAALSSMRSRMRLGHEVDVVRGEAVSPSYFETLGVFPAIGRGLLPEDEPVAAEPVALISHDLWRSRFNGDPGIVGTTLELNRSSRVASYGDWKRYTIVGVMPDGFAGIARPWEPTQFWIAALQHGADVLEDERASGFARGRAPEDMWVLPVARLKPGVASAAVAAEVEAFAAEFRARSPVEVTSTLRVYDSRRIQLPFDPGGRLVPERLAAGLMTVAGVLLLIAAANLGGMLIARGVSRRSEITLRLTLGAGAWRLARQLLTETMLLAAAGGVLGLALARWLIDLFVAGTPTSFARWQISSLTLDIPIDARVLAFTVGSCLLTGLVVGIAPVLQALRTDPARALSGGMGSTRPVRSALRHWIVVPQVCLSFVLLIAAGVMVRTLLRSELMHPGYDAGGVVMMDFELPRIEYPKGGWTREFAERVGQQKRTINDRVLERARASGRFTSITVGLTMSSHGLPLPWMSSAIVHRDGYAPGAQHYWTSSAAVAAGYFETLKIPVIHGRALDRRDRLDAPRVAVVSDQLARWMWPGRNPVGEYLGVHHPDSPHEPEWLQVVGVVGDVDAPFSVGWRPAYYRPAEQQAIPWGFTLVARGQDASADLLRALKTAIAEADPTVIATNGRTLEAAVAEMLYPRRAAAAILGLAGIVGLVLASAGLYGVVSFSVAQRVREIGVRMALGAERTDITRMILREGFVVIGMGLALGAGLAYAAIRLTARLVAPLPPPDAVTLIAIPAVLSAVILLACYLPAVRASRVNPIEVLRAL